MKTLLRIAAFLALLSGVSLFAQTATLTGTVTDPDGNNWDNAVWVYNVNNPFGGPLVNVCSGGAVQTQYTGTLSSGGVFSGTIPQTHCISPGGTTYTLVLTSITSAQAVTFPTQAINVSSYNAGTFASSNISLGPRYPCTQDCFGYATTEITGLSTTRPGAKFYNTTTGANPACNLWTGGTWISCGAAGGGGTVSSCTAGELAYYAATGNTVACLVIGTNAVGASGEVFGGYLYNTNNFGTLIGDTGAPPGTTGASCTNGDHHSFMARYENFSNGSFYICNKTAPTTYAWQLENAIEWNGVIPTNTPSSTNNLCVATTANSCTWGPSPGGGVNGTPLRGFNVSAVGSGTVSNAIPSGSVAGDFGVIISGSADGTTCPSGWTPNNALGTTTWQGRVCTELLTSAEITAGAITWPANGASAGACLAVFVGPTSGVRENVVSQSVTPTANLILGSSNIAQTSDTLIHCVTFRTASSGVLPTLNRGSQAGGIYDGSIGNVYGWVEYLNYPSIETMNWNWSTASAYYLSTTVVEK